MDSASDLALDQPGADRRGRILFLVTEDWYFWSHRVRLAKALTNAGFDVHVATRVQDHLTKLEELGLTVHALGWQRGKSNPVQELRALIKITQLLRDVKPDILHLVALKPILFGNIANKIIRKSRVVNAVSGLGASFIGNSRHARLLRRLVELGFSRLLRHPRDVVVVQNEDDADYFQKSGFVRSGQVRLVRGSGIDLDRFQYVPEPPDNNGVVVSIVSRMLWTKGIGESVEAVRRLHEAGRNVELRLIGSPDETNLDSIPQSTLEKWNKEPFIQWQGPRSDIPRVWQDSHIALLPSYREGLPLSLIEAAACGRPLVSTNVPGCREIVRPNVNGLMAELGNVSELANSIETLVVNKEQRQEFGRAARIDAEKFYSESTIFGEFFDLYGELLRQ